MSCRRSCQSYKQRLEFVKALVAAHTAGQGAEGLENLTPSVLLPDELSL